LQEVQRLAEGTTEETSLQAFCELENTVTALTFCGSVLDAATGGL